jgi:hypothetical protein
LKTTFQLGEHQIRVDSVHIGRLYGELYSTTREYFNEYSATAIQKFIDKMAILWGPWRKWVILTPAPIAGEEKKFRYRDYSEMIVGAAWLESKSILIDLDAHGSHAIIVWVQESDTDICLEKVLEVKTWEEIASDFYI